MTDPAAAVDAEERYRAAVGGAERFLNAWHGLPDARTRLESLADALDERERADRYGEGERLERLERRTAELLGKEAAVFMPSGTMAQQIAMCPVTTLIACKLLIKRAWELMGFRVHQQWSADMTTTVASHTDFQQHLAKMMKETGGRTK